MFLESVLGTVIFGTVAFIAFHAFTAPVKVAKRRELSEKRITDVRWLTWLGIIFPLL